MSLLKDTGACAFDGVTLLLKQTADRQMTHAKTSLLVKSSSYVLKVAGILVRLGYSWVKTKLLRCYFCVTRNVNLPTNQMTRERRGDRDGFHQ